MNYTESVIRKLVNPGMALLILGAILAYGSQKLAEKVFHVPEEQLDRMNLILKAAGVVIAIAGALMIFVTT